MTLPRELQAVNVGLATFADALREQGAPVVEVDWRPPADGDPAVRAVLERLSERRQELEAQARELEIRENLLKAAEQRIESRLAELSELETRINATTGKKTEAEAARIKPVMP